MVDHCSVRSTTDCETHVVLTSTQKLRHNVFLYDFCIKFCFCDLDAIHRAVGRSDCSKLLLPKKISCFKLILKNQSPYD